MKIYHTPSLVTRLGAFSLLLLPGAIAFAQTTGGTTNTKTLGDLFNIILNIIDAYLVPLIFAIAFIVFLWGVFQYFVLGGANVEKRKEGQMFALFGIIGLFVMLSIWGLVNLFVNTFGFQSSTRPQLPTFGTGSTATTPGAKPGSTGNPFQSTPPAGTPPTTPGQNSSGNIPGTNIPNDLQGLY